MCGSNTHLRAQEIAPAGTYTCNLQVNHVYYPGQPNATEPLNFKSCLDYRCGWPIGPPPCLIQMDVSHRLMSMGEFKDTFWK